MATASVSVNSGFDVNDFWVANSAVSQNEQFSGFQGHTGNPVLGRETQTYSSFTFAANGLTYTYAGEWTVTIDRGLIFASASAQGHYDSITVENGTGIVATYSGDPINVDFGSTTGIPLLNLVLGLLGLFPSAAESNPANLYLDATPTLPDIEFAHDDTITGGAGGDHLRGYAGADILAGGAGNDILDGGAGSDTADYSSATAALTISLASGLASSAQTGTDNLIGIENVVGGSGNDHLIGSIGANVLNGGGGTNTVDYSATSAGVMANLGTGQATGSEIGADVLINIQNVTGGSGNDHLTGNGGTNVLVGGAGNDTLDGGAGADVMVGGLGDDTYNVDNSGDVVTELSGQGNDTIFSSANYTLAPGLSVESLRANSGTGLALTGNESNNTLAGGAGNDTLNGGGGTNTADYAATTAGVTANLSTGQATGSEIGTDGLINIQNVTCGSGNDSLTGNGGTNVLVGGGGNDTLDGGAGADVMNGGFGDDTYFVDNAGDIVTEIPGQGADTIFASVGYTLSAGTSVEFLRANSISGLTLTGNELNNTIVGGVGNDMLNGGIGNDTVSGGNGNDFLNGGAGADLMMGGLGNEIYNVDNVGDVVSEAVGQGADTVYASVSYALAAGQEIETLVANAGATGLALDGNEFANVLVSGAGNDTLSGHAGNDTYYVNNAGDIVLEAAGQGNDAVIASVSYALAAGSEVERLVANAGATGITLTANGFANILFSGAGNDTLVGLAGNDTYFVNGAGDVVQEAANGGLDTVLASSDYALAAGQSVEYLRANAGAVGLTLTGNELANSIFGGAGNDTMAGLGGNDIYYVNNAADIVKEAIGQGYDTLYTTVSYSLSAGQEVESLVANGGATSLTLTGNEFANVLVSGAGNDTLSGLGGNDTYYVNNAGDVVLEAANSGTDTVVTSSDYMLRTGQEVEIVLANAGAVGLRLTGNELSTTFIGMAGNDTFEGGGGLDRYVGGGGNDTFVFQAVTDSSIAAPDLIYDFASGDRLDVHSIDANFALAGDQAFTLDAIGDNSFGAGHVRQSLSGTTLVLDFNVDGDAASEMHVVLLNHGSALALGDLIA